MPGKMLKIKKFLTGFAKDFLVSLSPPTLVMIVFEFLNFENEELRIFFIHVT